MISTRDRHWGMNGFKWVYRLHAMGYATIKQINKANSHQMALSVCKFQYSICRVVRTGRKHSNEFICRWRAFKSNRWKQENCTRGPNSIALLRLCDGRPCLIVNEIFCFFLFRFCFVPEIPTHIFDRFILQDVLYDKSQVCCVYAVRVCVSVFYEMNNVFCVPLNGTRTTDAPIHSQRSDRIQCIEAIKQSTSEGIQVTHISTSIAHITYDSVARVGRLSVR